MDMSIMFYGAGLIGAAFAFSVCAFVVAIRK